MAVDGHSVANPYDPRDAIFSAARYLAAAGAATDISRAILAYNHAGWYVDMVLARARAIAGGVNPHTQTNHHGIITTFFDQWQGRWRAPYRGGYLTHFTRLVAAANMVSAADFPYLWGGGHEQPARFGAFDCSGSVSYVLQQAGYRVPTSTSGNVPQLALPGRTRAGHDLLQRHPHLHADRRPLLRDQHLASGRRRGLDRHRSTARELSRQLQRGPRARPARRRVRRRPPARRAAERRAAHATHPAPLRFTPLPAQTGPKLQLTLSLDLSEVSPGAEWPHGERTPALTDGPRDRARAFAGGHR